MLTLIKYFALIALISGCSTTSRIQMLSNMRDVQGVGGGYEYCHDCLRPTPKTKIEDSSNIERSPTQNENGRESENLLKSPTVDHLDPSLLAPQVQTADSVTESAASAAEILDLPLSVEVYFSFNSATPKALDVAREILLKNIDLRIEVVGFTDNIGSIKGNKTIADARAKKIKQSLIAMGVDGARIATFARPMSNYKNDNSTEELRSLNRRVEINFKRSVL